MIIDNLLLITNSQSPTLKSIITQKPSITKSTPLFQIEEAKAPLGRVPEHWDIINSVASTDYLSQSQSTEQALKPGAQESVHRDLSSRGSSSQEQWIQESEMHWN